MQLTIISSFSPNDDCHFLTIVIIEFQINRLVAISCVKSKYSGSTVSNRSKLDKEISNEMAKASSAFAKL